MKFADIIEGLTLGQEYVRDCYIGIRNNNGTIQFFFPADGIPMDAECQTVTIEDLLSDWEPTERKHQWLYKKTGSIYWEGCTDQMTEEDFEDCRGTEFVYKRIES